MTVLSTSLSIYQSEKNQNAIIKINPSLFKKRGVKQGGFFFWVMRRC